MGIESLNGPGFLERDWGGSFASHRSPLQPNTKPGMLYVYVLVDNKQHAAAYFFTKYRNLRLSYSDRPGRYRLG